MTVLVGLLIVSFVVTLFLVSRVTKLKEQVNQLTENLAFQKKASKALAAAIQRHSQDQKKLKVIQKAVKDANGSQLDSIYDDIINGRL